MDDRQIIDLYNNRDEKAIEASNDKYGGYCYCIANNILMNVQDSQECVNDTWFNAWQVIPPQQPSCLKMFFAKITRNISLNMFNCKKRQKRGGYTAQAALDELGEVVSGGQSVEDEVISNQILSAVNAFLSSLPERDCALFIRRYFFFDSPFTISENYGVSVGNVHKILSRVRMQLKEHLKKEGFIL